MERRRWHPAPRGLVAKAGRERWTKDNQAPTLIGYLWAWHLMDDGERPTRREIARDLGWSEYRARKLLDEVRADFTEWQALTRSDRPPNPEKRPKHREKSPPDPSDYADIGEPRFDSGPTATEPRPIAGAGSTPTRTNRNIDRQLPVEEDRLLGSDLSAPPEVSVEAVAAPGSPGPHRRKAANIKSPKIDLDGLWDTLESVRVENRPNAKRAKLGKRRASLRDRVAEHGPDAVILAWRWWHTSDAPRARFLRSDYGYNTFLRPGNLRDYVQFSQEWNQAEQEGSTDLFDLGPDSFDSDGNLISEGR